MAWPEQPMAWPDLSIILSIVVSSPFNSTRLLSSRCLPMRAPRLHECAHTAGCYCSSCWLLVAISWCVAACLRRYCLGFVVFAQLLLVVILPSVCLPLVLASLLCCVSSGDVQVLGSIARSWVNYLDLCPVRFARPALANPQERVQRRCRCWQRSMSRKEMSAMKNARREGGGGLSALCSADEASQASASGARHENAKNNASI